jgi:hypothetical protein
MNPIKTPREMLFEMLGVPHMSGGKITTPFTLADQVAKAVAAFTRKFGKSPSPEDVKALEAYAQNMSQPTSGLRTGQSAVPRAQHELATDPNLINPDTARDEFLLQSMTGRGQKGTRLAPKVYDVTDPVNIQRMESNQLAGAYDDILAGRQASTTPSADFFATQAAARENAALGAGKIPLIDQLKMQFYKQTGRYPDAEELNTIIAEYNPMRHQYGAQGVSIVGSRPATAKGGAMETWRQAARNEGIPEKYVSKSPADYPQYLIDELEIQKGRLPGVAAKKERARKGSAPTAGSTITKYDEMGNPVEVQNFRDGSLALSPDQMRADMSVMGYAPSKFADPYQSAMADMAARRANPVSPSALARMKARAGRLGAGAMKGLNVAAVPFSAYDTGERFSRGDYPGAVMSGIATAANAAALHPALTLPASAVALTAEGTNMLRDYLSTPRSVMEEIK